MKRLFALILSAALIFALAAGCGSKEPEPTSAEPDVQETEEATEAPVTETDEPQEPVDDAYFPLEETGELSMWFCYPPFVTDYIEGPQEYLIYQEAMERLNLDIEFQAVPIPAARDQLTIMLSSGDMTDLVLGMFGNYSGTPAGSVEDEIIYDLTDYIAQYAPNYTNVLNSNENYRKQASTDDGRQLLFYYIESQEGQMENYGPIIRQDWLDKVNMEIPETYDDYHEVLTAFKNELGVSGALWIPHMGSADGSFLGAGLGVVTESYEDKYKPFALVDGKVVYGPLQDEYLDYLTLLHDWYEEGLIYPDFMSDTASYMYPADDIVTDGKTGIFLNIAKNLDSYASMTTDEDFTLAPIYNPVKSEGDMSHLTAGIGTYCKIGSATAVTTDCEDIELAVRYLDWWFSDEAWLLANYGVEGETFEFVDGKPTFTDMILKSELGQNTVLTLYTGATSGASFLFDNTKYTQLYSDIQLESGEIWSAHTDGAWDLPAIALTGDETSAFNGVYNDIITYVTENVVAFIIGSRSLDEFDDFRAQIEEMNIDQCISIYQDACDRYANR